MPLTISTIEAGRSPRLGSQPAELKAFSDIVCKTRQDSPPSVDHGLSDFSLSDWIAEIRRTWAQGADSRLELASLIATIRRRLPRGHWTSLWDSDELPFGKRKAEKLRAIGDGLGWAVNANVCSYLPTEWNVLYHLAKLERNTLECLIRQGLIHPELTLAQARQLAARFRGETLKTRSARAILRERLRRFGEFVANHLAEWSGDERELATEELTRLIEQVAIFHGHGPSGNSRSSTARRDVLKDQLNNL